MARLRIAENSDDELPDIRELMETAKAERPLRTPSLKADTQTLERARRSPRKAQARAEESGLDVTARKSTRNEDTASANLIPKTPRARAGETPARRQRALKAVEPNALLLPISSALAEELSPRKKKTEIGHAQAIKHTPKRGIAVKKAVQYRSTTPCSSDWEDDINEVTWCGSEESEEDSDTEDWLTSISSARKPARKAPQTRRRPDPDICAEDDGSRSATPWDDVVDLTTPKPLRTAATTDTSQRHPITQPSAESRPSSSPSTDQAATLHLSDPSLKAPIYIPPLTLTTSSPPRLKSPRKGPPRSTTPPQLARPSTPPPPPTSPSKSRLTSPSKKTRIPHRASLRESIDAFWRADVVNDWNDQHSPRKVLQSPKKPHFNRLQHPGASSSDGYISPSEARSPTKTPAKRTKAAIEARKAWDAQKISLAESFVRELDDTVTQGRISALAAPTGGIKVVWSRKLNTTAGRANWRREGTTSTTPDGAKTRTYIHHATIELAEKVLDSPERLINTLAHEFCHLATFMISHVRDNPHGREFKSWARNVESAFRGRYPELIISTKHAYEIDYKYVWACEGCGAEFKRHSRSIEPARQSCGGCRGRLVQVRPAPRRVGKGGYQAFVRERFAGVKRENPGMGMPEVMEVLGRMYRERKGVGAGSVGAEILGGGSGEADELDAVVRGLEVVKLNG